MTASLFALLVAACAGSAQPATPLVSVEGGFAANENFCAEAPLSGTIRYEVKDGAVTFDVRVGNLPHTSLIAIDWINDPVRGYTVAAFSTDATGRSIRDSLRMFRPGEVRGIGLHLAAADLDATVLGQLRPC